MRFIRPGPALLALALLLLALAAYSNHFRNSFHFDDSHTIVNNEYIRSVSNIPLFFLDGTTFSSLPTNQSYRPVVSATLALDYWLGGGLDDTFHFHLSMFVAFLLQGILMVVFYRRALASADDGAGALLVAVLAAGWYLVHPANAETINYIISRSDSFSTLFIVLAFVLYGGSARCRKWHLYLLPLAAGMLTKPVAAVFPVLLFFHVLLLEEGGAPGGLLGGGGRRGLAVAARRSAPALLLVIAALVFIGRMEPPTWTPGGASLFRYVITQPYVILKYFLSFFLPVSLSADTDLAPFESIADIRFVAGVVFLAALLAAAVLASARRRLRPVAFGILWFLLTLLPTSLIPLAEVMNDHRVFLPYVGLTLAAGWSAHLALACCRDRWPSFRHFNAVAAVLVAAVLGASACGTYLRNGVWKTGETLWKDVTEKSPGNGRGMMNYGLALMERGDHTGAEKYFLEALELVPNYAAVHVNLGALHEALGDEARAEEFFRAAIALEPRYPESYYFFARFLDRRKRHGEAVANLERVLELAPAHAYARSLLAAIRERVDTPEFHVDLSLSYYRAREFVRSIEAARRALELRPDYAIAYNNLCAAYNELQRWDEAIAAGRRAVALDPDNELARNNLAWAREGRAAAENDDGTAGR